MTACSSSHPNPPVMLWGILHRRFIPSPFSQFSGLSTIWGHELDLSLTNWGMARPVCPALTNLPCTRRESHQRLTWEGVMSTRTSHSDLGRPAWIHRHNSSRNDLGYTLTDWELRRGTSVTRKSAWQPVTLMGYSMPGGLHCTRLTPKGQVPHMSLLLGHVHSPLLGARWSQYNHFSHLSDFWTSAKSRTKPCKSLKRTSFGTQLSCPAVLLSCDACRWQWPYTTHTEVLFLAQALAGLTWVHIKNTVVSSMNWASMSWLLSWV